MQPAEHHPVAFGERDGRLWPGQQPDAKHHGQQHGGLRRHRQRTAPQRKITPGLGCVPQPPRRGHARRLHAVDFGWLAHALEAPSPERPPLQAFSHRAQRPTGATHDGFGHRRKQDLARACQLHQARRRRLGQAFDFNRLGASPHCLGAVLPGQHIAHMQTSPRLQMDLVSLPQRLQPTLVIQCKAKRVDRALEQHEQPVGAIDQLAVPALLQRQHQPVVFLEQFGGSDIADAFDQQQRVTQVGEQQGAQLLVVRRRRSVVAIHRLCLPI